MNKKFKLALFTTAIAIITSNQGYAYEASALETWVDGKLVTTFDGNSTVGAVGSITFDPWGFTGPGGRTAQDFELVNGFGNGVYNPSTAAGCILDPASCGIGQVQHVITHNADGFTQDPPHDIDPDFFSIYGPYPQANVDALTTFYKWGYASQGGSTFDNMLIDFDGDYQIAKDDMTFKWYNIIDYTQVIPEGGTRTGGTNVQGNYVIMPDGSYHNDLAFQPYALSDAKGWCGSVLVSHPNAHEAMAGQVQFDMAFDVYLRNASSGALTYMSTEIVNNFKMRSFGNITVDITTNWGTGDQQLQHARAVINNTDPRDFITTVDENTPVGDPAQWHNRVSFMGADVLTSGSDASGNTGDCGILNPEWNQFTNSGPGISKYIGLIKGKADQAACEADGGTWQGHAFSTYAFILRADAERVIDYFDEDVYGPNPMTLDSDSDGVLDYADNCKAVINPEQQDTDGDNFGNACDADFNNDGLVNSLDLGLFKTMFFTAGNVQADHNGDQIVNSLDLGLFKARFFEPVGPSGTAQ